MKNWEAFLELISNQLYRSGWYTQSNYVFRCKNEEEVTRYITDHCYPEWLAKQMVEQAKSDVEGYQ